jgi:hypothetical protein
MKPSKPETYPDISDILARKAEGRRELAKRTLGEKIDALEALRARIEPIRKAREARRNSKPSPDS